MRNTLYYGDNMDVFDRHFQQGGAVDLVYLDPPFNSEQGYNILFRTPGGAGAAAQVKAFADTWTWGPVREGEFETVVGLGGAVGTAVEGLLRVLGRSGLMAYLVMMALRLVELRRVMKPAASIYLHCDPTASHYLKLLMDAVFGPENFLSEVVWKRTHSHGGARRFGPVHDVLLLYANGPGHTWNPQFTPYSADYLEAFFTQQDAKGRYRLTILTGPGATKGASGRPWRGVDPGASGRHWAIPGFLRPQLDGVPAGDTIAALERLDAIGRIHWPKKEGGVPSLKQYVGDLPGAPVQDVWTDIPPVSSQGAERLDYPTQKPEALLERILRASSNPGDVVLDPFCGGGTTLAVAQRLNRRWIGIDVTTLATARAKLRLADAFGLQAHKDYDLVGEPGTLEEADVLARDDPHQFQCWALGLVGARPADVKRGADKGIDGRRVFFEHGAGEPVRREVLYSVKGGRNLPANTASDLRGVMEREGADYGVVLSLVEPTRRMKEDAAAAGFVPSQGYGGARRHPKLQCVTVGALLGGAKLDLPPAATARDPTVKAAREQAVEPAKRVRQVSL